MRIRKLALAAAAATLLLSSVATAAQAASLPVVDTDLLGGPFLVKPAAIVLTQDGAFFIGGIGPHFGRIDWSDWSARSASGTGVAWQNDCRPSCAQGTFRGFRVSVWLWQSALLNGRAVFTRMKYVYRYNAPKQLAWATPGHVLRYRDGWRG